jgi:hypothetical protein
MAVLLSPLGCCLMIHPILSLFVGHVAKMEPSAENIHISEFGKYLSASPCPQLQLSQLFIKYIEKGRTFSKVGYFNKLKYKSGQA